MDTRTQHTSPAKPSSPLVPLTFNVPRQELLADEFPDLAPGLVMSTFRARHVWSGVAWRRAFPGRGDQSALARRMVSQLLADTGRVDDARWVTAELVSNAVRHSRSGQARGFFVVEVLRGSEMVRIVVYDLGGGPAPDFSRLPGTVPETAEGGRGLAGVAGLAVRVGVAGDAVCGHAVWADLALTGDAAGAREGELVVAGPVAMDDRASRGAALSERDKSPDQVSAFGQELWAQQTLAQLRREWPDWAFLVVGYRWLAMRGKVVTVNAAGPEELRHALRSIPAPANAAEPVTVSGSAVSRSIECGLSEAAMVLPTLAGPLHGEPGVSGTKASLAPVSLSRPDVGGMRGDGGSGAGLCGPLTGSVPSPGVMTAERSVTGTWAVAGGGVARTGWWPGGWWRLCRGRGRSRPGSHPRQGIGSACRTAPVAEGEPSHRHAPSRLSAQVAAIAA
ncbi:ATP-binding protein [Nonomuraea sp. NPDC023979]|uniref:ATP-binding protein n=1 Tax=Nonomuraea sp. NPDC023979 TaxID=3154796 RepID=UPI0033CF54F1